MGTNALKNTDLLHGNVAGKSPVTHDSSKRTDHEGNQDFQLISSHLPDANQHLDPSTRLLSQPLAERLLKAREVANKLGVSERWVRDHTTRRSPKIRALKLGTLVRYRWADVELFMESLETLRPSRHSRFGV
jgi:predicted DNA-binding transcriptional regulator AlpA